MNNAAIANTILNQLGGNKFITMTGSKNFVGTENTLTMKLFKNNLKATHLKIEYVYGKDLYKMIFLRCSLKSGVVVLKELDEVYAEDLQSLFEQNTGLYCYL